MSTKGDGKDGDGDGADGSGPTRKRHITADGSVALPITMQEHDDALAGIVGEMSVMEELLVVPGVYDALRAHLRGEIVERAMAAREAAKPAPEEAGPVAGSQEDPDRVHRLIHVVASVTHPIEGSSPYETACGAAPDADGGSDADPALVTCEACRELAESLPRTRTRDRRGSRG